jgi:phage shock protein A
MPGKKRTTKPLPSDSTAWVTILEDIRSDNRATMEAVQGSEARLARQAVDFKLEIDGRLDVITTAVQHLRTDVNGLRTDVNGLRTDVNGLQTEVTSLRTDVNGLQTEVTSLRTDVMRIEGKVDKLVPLEDRVAALERRRA